MVMPGGSCRNTAWNLSLLGAEVTLLTQRYQRTLRSYGLEHTPPFRERFLTREGIQDSLCVFMAFVQDGAVRASTTYYDDAPKTFDLAAAHRARQLMQRHDAVVSCTDVAFAFWRAVVDEGPKRQFRCLLTSGYPLPDDYLKWFPGCDLLMINDDEVRALGFEPMEFCPVALEHGVRHVVVTLGVEGAALCATQGSRTERRLAPPLVHAVIHPVGAGDACAAGVIVALMRGCPLADAVDQGLAFANDKLGHVGNTAGPRIAG
jgi:sugar/nucleoside kinase (ribokinase family)